MNMVILTLLLFFPGATDAATCSSFFTFQKTERSQQSQALAAAIQESSAGGAGFSKLPDAIDSIDGAWSLRARALESSGSIVGGKNGAFLGVDASGKKVAVVKPIDAPYKAFGFLKISAKDIEPGGFGKREVLAKEVDDLLGFGLVPKTTFGYAQVGKKKQLVTMQEFLDGYKPYGLPEVRRANPTAEQRNWINLSAPATWQRKLNPLDAQKKILFDVIVGSQDRHLNNVMINEEGKLALIDNGYILSKKFITSSARTTFENGAVGNVHTEVNPALREKILSLDFSRLEAIFSRYQIPQEAIDHAKHRFDALQAYLREGKKLNQIIGLIPHSD